jgi:hypothetical protein
MSFEAIVARADVQRRFIDDLLAMFGPPVK